MKLRGQEDCLFLSVFTPKLPEKGSKLLPVFFWIHGGGFFMGSGNTDFYGPNRIMDHDVVSLKISGFKFSNGFFRCFFKVFVSINYRLGPLGFLSTFDDNMAGNQGLWDQIMALHWVQQNIESFGGDPNQVKKSKLSMLTMLTMSMTFVPGDDCWRKRWIHERGSFVFDKTSQGTVPCWNPTEWSTAASVPPNGQASKLLY